MLRLIKEWRISRSLDESRPLPPSPRGLDRLSVVHDALRSPAQMRTPPADLHTRTMEAVRRASRTRPQPAPRRFSALIATMGAILILCGLASLYTVVVPTPSPTTVIADGPETGSPANPENMADPATDRSLASTFRLPGFVQEFSGPSQRLIDSSIQAPVRYEAQLLLSDARRAAGMVLDRLPFVGGEVR